MDGRALLLGAPHLLRRTDSREAYRTTGHHGTAGPAFAACARKVPACSLTSGAVVIPGTIIPHWYVAAAQARRQAGCGVLSPPPSAPDGNPIAQLFAKRHACDGAAQDSCLMTFRSSADIVELLPGTLSMPGRGGGRIEQGVA